MNSMQWTSVKDELPPEKQDVLVVDHYGLYSVSRYLLFGECGIWAHREDQTRIGDVIYWMHLPSPPKK